MTYILFYSICISILVLTQSHVTNRTTNAKVYNPDESYLEITKGSVNKMYVTKDVKRETNGAYLEDLMYSLKNQNWTEQELPCLNHTLWLLHSLQNSTLWAVWDWDSVASQPQGILVGNRYQLGNFDECMHAPWFKTHEELKTQYCLAEIVLERTDNPVKRRNLPDPVQPYQSAVDYMQHRPVHSRPLNALTWGACVPAHCPPRAVERLMSTMLARSHLGVAGMRSRIAVTEPCQVAGEERQFDALFYAFIAIMGSLALCALICTYLNNKKNKEGPGTIKDEIIKAFSLKENAKNLLQVKKEGVEVFYGIRYLTLLFIVIDHQILLVNIGPLINAAQVDKDATSLMGMFVLHNDLFVDSFFLLSGFLAAAAFSKFKKLQNPIIFIIKRYVRIVVAFAVVIFFIVAVFPFIGSGPLWSRAIAGETDICRKNWWLSLLMLNNYVDSENICIIVSWYIPCDFHFFVVTVLLYWVYKRYPKVGVTCAGVLAVGSIILPAIITYVYELQAVQLFTYEFMADPRGSKEFRLTYIKSHTRYAAYIVGFFSGHLFEYCRTTGKTMRISQRWAVLGVCAGLTTMTVVMLGGATYLWRDYNKLESAVYAALNRPVWACGLALLALCCSLGSVPLVKRLLEWYPFVPLSRLSYGIYLTHTIFLTRNALVSRDGQYFDYLSLLTSAGGVIVLSTIAALIIWLIAEAPVNNLLTIFLKSRVSKKTNAEYVLHVARNLQATQHKPAQVLLCSKC